MHNGLHGAQSLSFFAAALGISGTCAKLDRLLRLKQVNLMQPFIAWRISSMSLQPPNPVSMILSGAAARAAFQVAAGLERGVVIALFPEAGYEYLSDKSLWGGA